MAKREKRPRRLAWFAMDVDAFLDDPRMQKLTSREKASWSLILIKSFRNQGKIITDPEIVAEQTGATKKEAKQLVAKLLSEGIITSIGLYEAISNRLAKEYEIALESYERYSKLGQQSAEKNGAANLQIIK